VVDGGSKAEAGSVEIFDGLAFAGVFGAGDFFGDVVELVVMSAGAGFPAVVVLVATVVVVVGGSAACVLRAASPCALTGMSC
jgi:hypothetical protein